MEERKRGTNEKTDRRKVSVYLPDPLLKWVETQRQRLGRSSSWIVQQALLRSREWVE